MSNEELEQLDSLITSYVAHHVGSDNVKQGAAVLRHSVRKVKAKQRRQAEDQTRRIAAANRALRPHQQRGMESA